MSVEHASSFGPSGDGSTSTISSKPAKIIAGVFLTVFGVFFVLLWWCIFGLRCPKRPARNRSRRTTASAFGTATTSAAIASRATTNTCSRAAASANGPGLDSRAVSSIPSFVFSSAAHEGKLECVVCLTRCKDGERGRLLMACGHSFHAECIDNWFQSHSTCPVCRSTVQLTVPELQV